jgi:hypothetical protein
MPKLERKHHIAQNPDKKTRKRDHKQYLIQLYQAETLQKTKPYMQLSES